MTRLRRAWRAFWSVPTSPRDGARLVIVEKGVTVEVALDDYRLTGGVTFPPRDAYSGNVAGLFLDRKKYGAWVRVTGSFGPVPLEDAA